MMAILLCICQMVPLLIVTREEDYGTQLVWLELKEKEKLRIELL